MDGKALAVRLPKNLLTTLRDQLTALSGAYPETQVRYDNAINALNRAIDSNAWTDGSHLGENGSIVLASIATAARQLLQIHNPPPSVTAIIAALADSARELAQIAIEQVVLQRKPAADRSRATADSARRCQCRERRLRQRDPLLSTHMAASLAAVNGY